jgi:uncharacterized protein
MSPSPQEIVDLLDWRRQVFELYHQVRVLWSDDPGKAHQGWRTGRDQLAGSHPQSPFAGSTRAHFAGLDYFPYDAALAFTAPVEPAAEDRLGLPTSTGGSMAFVRFGCVRLPMGTLDVYWLDAYGGGLFLPFRDATAGSETYGGGRYLLDTVKGADLGSTGAGELVLDFNFAYHPSCYYRDDWTCPLPSAGNWLDVPIEAVEGRFTRCRRIPKYASHLRLYAERTPACDSPRRAVTRQM